MVFQLSFCGVSQYIPERGRSLLKSVYLWRQALRKKERRLPQIGRRSTGAGPFGSGWAPIYSGKACARAIRVVVHICPEQLPLSRPSYPQGLARPRGLLRRPGPQRPECPARPAVPSDRSRRAARWGPVRSSTACSRRRCSSRSRGARWGRRPSRRSVDKSSYGKIPFHSVYIELLWRPPQDRICGQARKGAG